MLLFKYESSNYSVIIYIYYHILENIYLFNTCFCDNSKPISSIEPVMCGKRW